MTATRGAAQTAPGRPVNPASVRHLSPFRYPGGKTWLVPQMRAWLRGLPGEQRRLLVEPFAGGATIGLTAAFERLVDRVELVELDDDVAAVWEVLFHGTDTDVQRLGARILAFDVTEDTVSELLAGQPATTVDRALRTIVKNRCQRGGILAPGAGLMRAGENGHGLRSRWYPATLAGRLLTVAALRPVVGFTHGDAFDALTRFADATAFIDPPYTAGGTRAGARLYRHHTIDHEALFAAVAHRDAPALLTYDTAPEVYALAATYGLTVRGVPMTTTHHRTTTELVLLHDPTPLAQTGAAA